MDAPASLPVRSRVAFDRFTAVPAVGVAISETVVACAWMIVVTVPIRARSRTRPPEMVNRFVGPSASGVLPDAAAVRWVSHPRLARVIWLFWIAVGIYSTADTSDSGALRTSRPFRMKVIVAVAWVATRYLNPSDIDAADTSK